METYDSEKTVERLRLIAARPEQPPRSNRDTQNTLLTAELTLQLVVVARDPAAWQHTLVRPTPKTGPHMKYKPHLSTVAHLLKSGGVGDVLLCHEVAAGERAGQVDEESVHGLRLRRVPIALSEVGIGRALQQVSELLHDWFFLVHSGAHLIAPFERIAGIFALRGVPAMMLAYPSDTSKLTRLERGVAVNDQFRVVSYGEGPKPAVQLPYVDAGMVLMRRDLLTTMDLSGVRSLEGDLYPRLVAESKIGAYILGSKPLPLLPFVSSVDVSL